MRKLLNKLFRYLYTRLNLREFDPADLDYQVTLTYQIQAVDLSRQTQKSLQVSVDRGNSASLLNAILQLEQFNTQLMHTVKGFED